MATCKLAGVAGVTAIEVRVALITFKVTAGLVIPDSEAVILVFPAARAAARPEEEIVATVVLELVQVTSVLIF